jgi:hypothetical protein
MPFNALVSFQLSGKEFLQCCVTQLEIGVVQLTIRRSQQKTMLGGLLFTSHITLLITPEYEELYKRYALDKYREKFGQTNLVWKGATLQELTKGVEISYPQANIVRAIELRLIEALINIRNYLESANSFNGSITLQIPQSMDELMKHAQFFVAELAQDSGMPGS